MKKKTVLLVGSLLALLLLVVGYLGASTFGGESAPVRPTPKEPAGAVFLEAPSIAAASARTATVDPVDGEFGMEAPNASSIQHVAESAPDSLHDSAVARLERCYSTFHESLAGRSLKTQYMDAYAVLLRCVAAELDMQHRGVDHEYGDRVVLSPRTQDESVIAVDNRSYTFPLAEFPLFEQVQEQLSELSKRRPASSETSAPSDTTMPASLIAEIDEQVAVALGHLRSME